MTSSLRLLLLALAGGLPVSAPAFSDAAATGANSDWALPVPPPAVVARPFVQPAARWLPGHRGVDLQAPAGTAVRAAGDGTVVFAGMVAGRPVVSLSHGELRTTYEPVAASASVGARVHKGDVIGQLLAGPSHCAPAACLHWGAVRAGTYLDPMSLLVTLHVRLLPLGDAP